MQCFVFRSLASSGKQWRPLLFVAGAAAGAAVAAGTFYYFYSRKNQQQRTRELEDDQEATVAEATVASILHHAPSTPQPQLVPEEGEPPSSIQSAAEEAEDMSPHSHPTQSTAPSKPKEGETSSSIQSVLEATEDMSPQTSPTPSPRTPSVTPLMPLPPQEFQPEPLSPTQSAAEEAEDMSPQSPSTPSPAPSTPQEGETLSSIQSVLEATEDTCPQSPPTSSPRAPSVAPLTLLPQQEPLCSTQSAAEGAEDMSPQSPSTPSPAPSIPQEEETLSSIQSVLEATEDTCPQSPPTSSPRAPSVAPLTLLPPQEFQPEPLSPTQSAAEEAEDMSSQSPSTPSPAPSTPQEGETPSSIQSVFAETEDISPQSPPTSSPRAPSVAPLTPLPPQEFQPEPLSPTQSAAEAARDMSPQSPPTSSPRSPSVTPLTPQELQPEPLSPAQIVSSIQSAPGAFGAVPPEAHQVPALHYYFTAKGTSSFPLKLSALRQAFTIVLTNSHHSKYLTIAGRVILGGLAARNAREVPAFQQAYNSLIAVAQDASYREALRAELAQIGIQHFNFIDVVYELVLMGVFQAARPPIFPTPGGFLWQLMDMFASFSPLTAERRPRAEQYLLLLQHEALLLLDNIFGGEEHIYLDPGSLALAVWSCLEKHIQQILLRLRDA